RAADHDATERSALTALNEIWSVQLEQGLQQAKQSSMLGTFELAERLQQRARLHVATLRATGQPFSIEEYQRKTLAISSRDLLALRHYVTTARFVSAHLVRSFVHSDRNGDVETVDHDE